jgi:hypothetical protein
MSRYRFVVPVLLSLGAAAGPSAAFGQVGISVNITIAPPPLPIYVQPAIPAPGYIWTPGYWAYGPDGYYWVPGTWIQPPQVGLLWTPAWWGWNNGAYVFNDGYWGSTVGFYGGINYGFGYGGSGYQGGYWNRGAFYYNRNVNNISNVHITNVYNRTVINNNTHVSFNGGQGGISARPSAQQLAYEHAQHTPPTAVQTQHIEAARTNHALLASVNNGRPPIAATARPGEFTGKGIVPARSAGGPVHLAPAQHATPAATGAPHEAPGPAITPHPGTPGAAPALRTPAETGHPAAAPHEGTVTPETHAPASEVHGAPTPETHPTQEVHPGPAAVHPEAAPHPETVPHPEAAPAARPEAVPAPHPVTAPHPEAAPRPAAAPHPEVAPRPAAAPHPEAAPHPAAAPHPQAAPRPAPAPHPEAAPHPAAAPASHPEPAHDEKKPG